MLKIILSLSLTLFSVSALSEDDHGEEAGHGEHGEHEEKLDGFKLNAASFKTFELKLMNYSIQKTIVPKLAVYKGLNEVNVYRLRAGLYKRIDFKILSQIKNDLHISSPDLALGDQIVVSGIGFLRMAEIAASGGLSDSHSH